MPQTIRCYDSQGNAVDILADQLQFTPAVYGIFIENEQVLLLRAAENSLWQLPGAWLGSNETPDQLLRRLFRQLLGIMPLIGPLLFVEDRYELDKRRQGWHVATLYYALGRPSSPVPTLAATRLHSQAAWIPLNQLERQQLHFGYEAIKAGELNLSLST